MWDQASVKLSGGPHGLPRAEVAKVQRQRLLLAMADVVAQVGYQRTTVRRLLARAGVSRRTYYELFVDKEDCFLAAYDEAVEHVLALVRSASGARPAARPWWSSVAPARPGRSAP